MILTYGNQSIDLFGEEDFPDGPPKQIFVGVSGGLDSAALLYLIATKFPEIEIHTYSGNDDNHPMDYLNAINVLQWFEDEFPEIDIRSPYIFKYNGREERWVKEAEELIASGKKPGFSSVAGVAKTVVMNKMINEYWFEHIPDAIRISGMTANPPIEDMKEFGFYDDRESRRDKGQNIPVFSGRVYQPLVNVDKKFVAGVFKEHGLMEELFKLTGSCIATPEQQNWGDSACGKCWWCKEKEWAFGEY